MRTKSEAQKKTALVLHVTDCEVQMVGKDGVTVRTSSRFASRASRVVRYLGVDYRAYAHRPDRPVVRKVRKETH